MNDHEQKQFNELKSALREAMQWNWLDEQNPPPREVIERCHRALGELGPVQTEVCPGCRTVHDKPLCPPVT